MKRINEFERYLHVDKRLADKTIVDYLSYIDRVEKDFQSGVEDLAATRESAWKALGDFPVKLKVSKNSMPSYGVAFRLAYAYLHGEELGRGKAASSLTESQNETHWYQECRVENVRDVEDCLRFIKRLNARNRADVFDPRCWAFRGQGDAAWGLESSLGRLGDYPFGGEGIGERMRLYERESMWTFQREASKFLEYRDYQGVDLLALMQHYECKTRLLDFTMAPLTALYMALDQCETDFAKVEKYATSHWVPTSFGTAIERPDFALWAVDLNALSPKGSCASKSCNGDCEDNTVEKFYEEAIRVLANPVCREDAGVLPVFPKKCNVRISAQDGLFLMPKCLDCSFEDNLRACMELPGRHPMKISGVSENEQIYKFVFASSLLAEVREVLQMANVTAKTVYPDLMGLGRFAAQEMQRHSDDQRIARER